jgi:hypothetical protein
MALRAASLASYCLTLQGQASKPQEGEAAAQQWHASSSIRPCSRVLELLLQLLHARHGGVLHNLLLTASCCRHQPPLAHPAVSELLLTRSFSKLKRW